MRMRGERRAARSLTQQPNPRGSLLALGTHWAEGRWRVRYASVDVAIEEKPRDIARFANGFHDAQPLWTKMFITYIHSAL